jgi:hypothetical protein
LTIVPSGSKLVAPSKLIVVPVGAVVTDCVKSTVGGASLIVLVLVALEESPALSVAVTFTMKVPAVTYKWLSVTALPGRLSVVPSPQLTKILVTVPSISEEEMVIVIAWSLKAVLVDSEKPTIGPTSSTVAVTLAECDRRSDDPVTVTVYVPGVSDESVRVEPAEPPGTSATIVRLNEPVIPVEVKAVRETLPLNACKLDTFTPTLTVDPAGNATELGLTDRVKSGGILTVMF